MNIFCNFIIFIFLSNMLLAGCGSCHSEVAKKNNLKHSLNDISDQFVSSVPKNGNIEGIVVTSCGTCNFSEKGRGCSLSIKVGNNIYSVKGTSIKDHGDMHAKEGLCSLVRVAWVKGKIKKNIFQAESFKLVGS